MGCGNVLCWWRAFGVAERCSCWRGLQCVVASMIGQDISRFLLASRRSQCACVLVAMWHPKAHVSMVHAQGRPFFPPQALLEPPPPGKQTRTLPQPRAHTRIMHPRLPTKLTLLATDSCFKSPHQPTHTPLTLPPHPLSWGGGANARPAPPVPPGSPHPTPPASPWLPPPPPHAAAPLLAAVSWWPNTPAPRLPCHGRAWANPGRASQGEHI